MSYILLNQQRTNCAKMLSTNVFAQGLQKFRIFIMDLVTYIFGFCFNFFLDRFFSFAFPNCTNNELINTTGATCG